MAEVHDEKRPARGSRQPAVRWLNEGDQRPLGNPGPRAIVVLGLPRGGTTLIAGLVQILGVEFGDFCTDRGEDAEVLSCISMYTGPLAPAKLPIIRRRLSGIVRRRTDRWGVWGVKIPNMSFMMNAVAGVFPDPYYIAVTRNPMAVAVTVERRKKVPFAEGLFNASLRQAIMTRFLSRSDRPSLVISYEEAVQQPEKAVDALADFLGVTPSEAVRARAIAFIDPTAGYMPSRRVVGWIEKVEATRVRGWVSDFRDLNRSLAAELWLDGTRLASQPADRSRQDVVTVGLHATGKCGFDFRLESPLTPEQMSKVSVLLPEIGHHVCFRLDDRGEAVFHPPSEVIALRSPAASVDELV